MFRLYYTIPWVVSPMSLVTRQQSYSKGFFPSKFHVLNPFPIGPTLLARHCVNKFKEASKFMVSIHSEHAY